MRWNAPRLHWPITSARCFPPRIARWSCPCSNRLPPRLRPCGKPSRCTTPRWQVTSDIPPPDEKQLFIEPLDPKVHNRSDFSCGVSRLDNFLKRSARKQQAGDFTRVWVLVAGERSRLLGYYALNAHKLEVDQLPTSLARNAPSHGEVPAAYLSMIAVDRRHQGRGLGNLLLSDAVKRVTAVAAQIGLKAIVLDVIDDGGPEAAEKRASFYRSMGFRTLPSRPDRMILSIETIRRAMDL
ncbi:MAG: GNAT family N-acetyltransferase [Gammaproteobacteria bacterium]|nr:GNAT family N-acetyltransferase [Gammaproteobacteria bacterium]